MIPFISDDDLSAYLGTTVSETDLNTVIALDAACQTVRDELHLQVNYLEGDEVRLDGTGTRSLILPELPVIDVAEVRDENGDVVDPDRYDWDYRTGILWHKDWHWWWGHLNHTVTYTHGWALAEAGVSTDPVIERVPSSIRLVALRLASAIYRATQASTGAGGAIQSKTIGSYSYTLSESAALSLASQTLTDEDQATLAAWYNVRAA